MPTVKFEIAFSTREYELLVAAKSDRPHPDRIRALLISEARSTLRRMIEVVDQERNAKLKSGNTLPVREHLRRRKPSLDQRGKTVLDDPPLVIRRSNTRKPMQTDGSAQWLDDDNVGKLRRAVKIEETH